MLGHAQRWLGTGFVSGTNRANTGFSKRDKTHSLDIHNLIYGVTPRLEISMSLPRKYVIPDTKQRKYDTANVCYSMISSYYAKTVRYIYLSIYIYI